MSFKFGDIASMREAFASSERHMTSGALPYARNIVDSLPLDTKNSIVAEYVSGALCMLFLASMV